MTERNRTDKLEAPSNAIGKILSFIRERRYQPSERLPSERDFAEKFDTSRGAVREALAALETMRVIERRPNSGIYLRKIEESSIDALVLYAESGVRNVAIFRRKRGDVPSVDQNLAECDVI